MKILAPLAAAVLLVTPLAAGDDPSLFFDTVDVYVVNVEVIVTDKDGKPATGLTRDDFEIYEDGEPVEVANFFAVEGRQKVAGEAGGGETLEARLPAAGETGSGRVAAGRGRG